MFLLRIGLGRSKGLMLNHIFLGITALILTSAVAYADDGEDLLKAALAGDLAQIRTLLEKGTDIDHQDRHGATALIAASQNGHAEIVQALLARGAEIDIQDEYDRTALILSSQQGHEEVVQTLLAKGAEINHQRNDGVTALIIASEKGHEGVVQALLARGAEIDLQIKNGSSALMVASEAGKEGTVEALLARGAEIDLQNKNGGTALLMASQNGHEAVVQALLAKGAEIDHQAKNGVTALFIASVAGHQRIVQALLAEGANVNLRENGGGTALKHAKTQQIKQLLRSAAQRKSLLQKLAAVSNREIEPGVVIPFSILGKRWTNRGRTGYVCFWYRGGRLSPNFWRFPSIECSGLASGSSGSFAEGDFANWPNSSPTGDGSIIVFDTNGEAIPTRLSLTIVSAVDDVVYFGVAGGIGLVHLDGKGRVICPDGTVTLLAGTDAGLTQKGTMKGVRHGRGCQQAAGRNR